MHMNLCSILGASFMLFAKEGNNNVTKTESVAIKLCIHVYLNLMHSEIATVAT